MRFCGEGQLLLADGEVVVMMVKMVKMMVVGNGRGEKRFGALANSACWAKVSPDVMGGAAKRIDGSDTHIRVFTISVLFEGDRCEVVGYLEE